MLPLRRASTNIGVRFYLYAILFVLFDVEAVFLFPWILSFVELGAAAYYQMLVFILVLGAGLGYAWKKGALQWR
jgi:NADH:ubiquinone oxidoreductase subunit 3 (subunit A)